MLDKVIFINSHPIQYFVPLYQYLTTQKCPVETWYCSDENIGGHFDRQFNTTVSWDIPLTEGYNALFFRNISWHKSLYGGFLGLINPWLLLTLWRQKRALVIVHGWGYFTHAMAIVVGCLAGHRICIRGESPWNQEQQKSWVLRSVKTILLRHILFRFVHRFLYIGEQNRQFYLHYGVAPDKMHFMPYAVDNERFQRAALELRHSPSVIRQRWGIPENARVVLFVAKYIPKKRPLDLLHAIALLNDPGVYTVMVGEGPMRTELEDFIKEKGLHGVILTGFVNQMEIPAYYAAADIFVLCSGVGETWGLSVNEAMNFDLPVVISSTAGCSSDLVHIGENGYVFQEGDVTDLSNSIRRAFFCDGSKSRKLVDQYSFNQIINVIQDEL